MTRLDETPRGRVGRVNGDPTTGDSVPSAGFSGPRATSGVLLAPTGDSVLEGGR